MDIKIIDFQSHNNREGKLSVAEYKKEIPFLVKRIYYLYNIKKNVVRGKHCHKKLKQIYIAISGHIKVKLTDGKTSKIISLNNPCKGLYIGSSIWREIYDFSPNGILLVLASDTYHEDDYIRDYKNFLKFVRGN